jgi:tyrosine phenol-lyase
VSSELKDDPLGAFSVPYEIAVARPLRQTSRAERAAALRAVHFNTELLPQDLIYIDLSTDSGVSALSTQQLALAAVPDVLEPGMGLAADGSRAYALLDEQIQRHFGFPWFVPTTQGRAAERLWSKIHVKPGTVVAGNMLFPSTRIHIEMNGGRLIDVIGDAAHELTSNEPFKGNIDIDKLQNAITEHSAEKISCIYVELSVNACGGHPVSLANLRVVKEITAAHRLPLFLDACRILENSFLIKEREPGQQNRSIGEIVRDTCALADGCTLSALKDFLVPAGGLILTRDKSSQQKAMTQSFLDGAQPSSGAMVLLATALAEIFAAEGYLSSRLLQVKYLWQRLEGTVPVLKPPAGHAVFIDVKKFLPELAPECFPAESLAAFVYEIGGIRMTKGPPLAPNQLARGVDLLRLALPARKYLQGHMDDIAQALSYAQAHRSEIKGLKRIEDVSRSKYEPAHFTSI